MHFAISCNRTFKALASVLGTGPGRSGVEAEPDRIDVRMGWAFRSSIPRASVREVELVARIPALMELGVHGLNGAWSVNGSSAGVVKVASAPAGARVLSVPVRLGTLYLSLEEPDAFVVAASRLTTGGTP